MSRFVLEAPAHTLTLEEKVCKSISALRNKLNGNLSVNFQSSYPPLSLNKLVS